MLSRDDIHRALLTLAGELAGMPVRCEIVVFGGAALVLLYGAREATKDVDVVILRQGDPSLVRLAERAGQVPPAWASSVEVAESPVWLVKAARTMPRLRKLCELEGPEPLRRRGILAPPEFLTVA